MSRLLRPAVLLIAVAVSSLGLVGCTAAAAHPAPSSGGAGRQASAAPESPAAVATPAATPATSPAARFGVPCDALLDPATLGYASITGPTGGDVADNLTLGLDGAAAANAAQLGLLHCVWGDANGGTGTSITVSALPDQRAAAQQDIAAIRGRGGTALDVGDDSAGACYASPFSCYGEVSSGAVWFYVGFTGQPGGTAHTSAQGMAMLSAVAKSVDARLTASAPAAAAVAGATGWSSTGGCAQLGGVAALTSAIGAGTWVQGEEAGDEDGPMTAAYNTGTLSCGWQPSTMRSDGTGPAFNLTVVPGASWVWPLLGASSTTTSTAVSVPGATDAAYRCQQSAEYGKQCWGDAISDGAWLQVHFDYGTDGTEQHTAAALAAVIAGHRTS